GLANLKKDSGDLDAAEELFREALEIEQELPREQHPVLASCLQGLAEVLMERGHASAAEPLLREALDIRRVRLSEGDRRIAMTQSVLGECLVSLENYGQAETLLSESYPVIETAFGPQHRITQEAQNRLVDLYESTGQPELADSYRPGPEAAHSDDLIRTPEPALTENPSG
ncbi:MAG: tetratricopeptide repeat protein, partial [Planctomycetota bacterium]|nr:tetratricopeptide repeat protein [Planctomycetota bacterium]